MFIRTSVTALMVCGLATTASAETSFHLDFSKNSGTTTVAGQGAPHSYGDYDGGNHYDDNSYISKAMRTRTRSSTAICP